jgi:alcohol dehydrogenase (cytochrome c)
MWRRTFDSAGFSPLKQIDRRNVQRLGKAWSLVLDQSGNEITPLVHGGILFVHSGASLTAVDAASGTPLWKYQREIARSSGAARQFDAGGRA